MTIAGTVESGLELKPHPKDERLFLQDLVPQCIKVFDDAFSISSRMTVSYVWPFEPNLRSISFVSLRRETVVAPAMFLYAWTP